MLVTVDLISDYAKRLLKTVFFSSSNIKKESKKRSRREAVFCFGFFTTLSSIEYFTNFIIT